MSPEERLYVEAITAEYRVMGRVQRWLFRQAAPFTEIAARHLAEIEAETGLTTNTTEKENPMEHDDQQCSNPETLCDDCLCYGAQENR